MSSSQLGARPDGGKPPPAVVQFTAWRAYEAAAWSIISARRYRAQAAAVRARICAELGATRCVAGEEVPVFPLPERLLTADALPGMAANRVARLRAVARAALDGQLAA